MTRVWKVPTGLGSDRLTTIWSINLGEVELMRQVPRTRGANVITDSSDNGLCRPKWEEWIM